MFEESPLFKAKRRNTPSRLIFLPKPMYFIAILNILISVEPNYAANKRFKGATD